MMRHFFAYIVLFATFSLQAQEKHYIGLEESKQAVLEYSNAIKNGKLQVESAEYGKEGAKASRYPTVSGTVIGAFGFRDFVEAIPPVLNNGINNFYSAGVTAMQPLYAGGRIKNSIKMADLQVEVRKVLARQTKDSVMLQTEQRYWNIVQIQEQQKTLLANQKLLEAILKQQKDMLVSGLIARNDLLKSKVRLGQLLLDKSRLENSRKVALYDFALMMGKPFDSLMVAKDELGEPVALETQFVSPETALLQNTNYDLLLKNIEVQKLQTDLAKSQYRPSVSVGMNIGMFGSIGNSFIGNQFMPMTLATVSIPISERCWGTGKYRLKQLDIS